MTIASALKLIERKAKEHAEGAALCTPGSLGDIWNNYIALELQKLKVAVSKELKRPARKKAAKRGAGR